VTDDSLAARVAAVERALTDGDPVADLSDAAETQRRLDRLTDDLADLTERVDALEATVQSLHGYVGEIEHVNERVERRADAARAAVERLDEQSPGGVPDRPVPGAEGGEPRSEGVAVGSDRVDDRTGRTGERGDRPQRRPDGARPEAGNDRPDRTPTALDEDAYALDEEDSDDNDVGDGGGGGESLLGRLRSSL
jgi:hypothetical protein